MFEESIPRTIVIIALVVGLVGVLAVQTVMIPQQVEAAGCESGFPNSAVGFNASKGRCFGH